MTKPTQRSEIQGFSKGLITEVNPLNSQIDTTVAEVNFELNRDGTRSRRLGLDIEGGGIRFNTNIPTTQLTTAKISSFMWKGAAGRAELQFMVSRIGETLRFFELGSGSTNPSTLVGTLTLSGLAISNISFAAVQGFLIGVTGTSDLVLIEFNPTTSAFSQSKFRLKIRDFFGIEETLNSRYETDVSYRGPLNWQHYYNLYNQGWAIPRRPWSPVSVITYRDAVSLGSNSSPTTQSPSSVDRVWSGMVQRPRPDPGLPTFEAFNYDQFGAITGVQGFVSKGFFLIDAFNRGSSRQAEWINHRNKYPRAGRLLGSFNPPADTTSGGPTSIATHAGRIFYSGINGVVSRGDKRSPNYNNYVFFTQLIKNRQDFGKCYQEGDPTSRESFDLIDTDGGYIVIPEAINIHTMYSMGDQLFLIAENGVWAVAGGSGYGFTATNYMVTRLSTFGGHPGHSFVEMGGTGFFWGVDGIYTIAKNQMGDYEVINQTKSSINSFFKRIPGSAHETVQGYAERHLNQIRWIYQEVTGLTVLTKELVLDLNFNAFIPINISQHPTNQAIVLHGAHNGDFSTRYVVEGVRADLDDVFVLTDAVILDGNSQRVLTTNAKYLTAFIEGGVVKLAFCEYNNLNYEDWNFTGSPVDAPAFMETNTFTGGDFAIKKQIPYLVMAFAETEKTLVNDEVGQASSCIGRFMWDFAHRERSNKWTRNMQLYRKRRWFYDDYDIDNGFTLNIVKSKVRGIGKSFALHVETEPRKNCHIYGWNLTLTSNNLT